MGVVAHAFNPSTEGAEADGADRSLNSRPVWSTHWSLHREDIYTLFRNQYLKFPVWHYIFSFLCVRSNGQPSLTYTSLYKQQD